MRRLVRVARRGGGSGGGGAARRLGAALVALAVSLAPTGAAGQLRPLDPVDWRVFDAARPAAVELGIGVFAGQRAALAGVEGRLVDAGLIHAHWRTGRMAIQVGGTAIRHFEDDAAFRPPAPETELPDGRPRVDAGDFRLSALLAVTDPARPTSVAIHFGTRLPTTDNVQGLERDQTDFFGLVTARHRRGPLVLSGDWGIGIWGTRHDVYEQADVWVYALAARLELAAVRPFASVTGQWNPASIQLSGTENLSELRAGVEAGGRLYVRGTAIRGLETFSPDWGLTLLLGLRL